MVELEIGVFCANMPFCYPIFLRCIPNSIKDHVADGVQGFASKHRGTSSRGFSGGKSKKTAQTRVRSWVQGGSSSHEGTYGMDELDRASIKSDAEILADKQGIYVQRDYEVAVCEERSIEDKR